ncbi:MAG: bifunctional 5,10-methylenetetrahydrofolate dehydrogenase/5,10-methenyltetrahydrofolate cyclohydrolase [Thermoplasmata archaeon]|jgi:methylenetetrahydrofolate dehydrogenase (NADP+)/methenyltetrahydrofolate cyclohydrolase|nr:bifunctional 5,10-methylenetetrahydrofolate dehydrogenase/5,10-methenyltetrahydrofolate cyclohydrolase [Candidatus Sysuiplasma jiujiangense]MBX8640198.1 bifunctional 5,10-methylenetetrahydrofolate dehydrogenase/5,10-methenyltetrahydrofolate cyclohydrolase [Candidatus Sysuiplasma jiujiangense]MBX8642392.1 bifunctional 5,10-methylenetetrahydrofolate dehydrogenase/5,10-methenyltetrahydrofolate cyclohydrolase [Candidatus Sysuiplasma jiujiangense]
MSPPRIIDGRRIAASINSETREKLKNARSERRPAILSITIGSDPSSESYLRQKQRAANSLGIELKLKQFSRSASEDEIIEFADMASEDGAIDAIMLHSPVPPGFDADRIAAHISPSKDVDCMSMHSRGLLYSGKPLYSPATAEAVVETLRRENVQISGKHVVIIGRSLVVGKPLASLLLVNGERGDATVTVCHSKTAELPSITVTADILVAAIGKAHFVTGEMVRKGTVVIDVGINASRTVNGLFSGGITGDVDFASVSQVAAALTPVPGGVGPVTTAILMRNVVKSWTRRIIAGTNHPG